MAIVNNISKALLLLLLVGLPAYAEKLTVVGDAYALGSDELVYREYHYYSDDGLDHRVVYATPDNEKMAEKVLNYRSGKTTPEVSHQALVFPETINIAWDNQGEIEQLMIAYANRDQEETKAALQVNRPLVIDAGFDNYVRENWPSLLTGASFEFYFPAPTRMSLVNLMIKQKICDDGMQGNVCFSVNSSNWFIRLLLDPIELSYDNESQQLSRFKGLGNMLDTEGNGIKVDIRYRYQGLCVHPERCEQVTLLN